MNETERFSSTLLKLKAMMDCEMNGPFGDLLINTPRQMPQMITNIPRSLRRFCQFRSFGINSQIHFLGKKTPLILRGLNEKMRAPSLCQKGQYSPKANLKEMTPKLLALTKVCTVLGNIRDVSWHMSKCGRE